MELSELRQKIDEIDDEIARQLILRSGCVSMIGAYKKEHKLQTFDRSREDEKLQTLAKSHPIHPAYLRIFQSVMDRSKELQDSLSTLRIGLLGRKLGHSYSREIHALLAPYQYALIEKEPEELASFLKNGEFDGLNVTIPYKKAVLPYCDMLDDDARRVGCVNTVFRSEHGSLVGCNTDVYGFSETIKKSGIDVVGRKALIFGSGGASAAVQCALKDHGIGEIVVISRSGENNYENLSKHTDAQILVNATPLGMWPDVDSSPCDISIFPVVEGVFDVVYNPLRTRFLMQAEELGIPCMGGLYMLVAQACLSCFYFTSGAYTAQEFMQENIFRELSSQKENIVLIGMPGCGKSTVGKAIAFRTDRPFFDTDAEFERVTGFTPAEYLLKNGEEPFRRIESEILKALGCRSGCVIATGGGCVTRTENYDALHQNGRIIWLRRALDDLNTEDRPLSQNIGINALFEQREPLYRRFADITISNEDTVEKAAASILEALS